MLSRLKSSIFNNLLLILALASTTLFFYLSLKNPYFSFVLFIFLIFFNFYYLRGPEIFLSSILTPSFLILLSYILDLNQIYLTLIWPFYYFLFIKNSKLGWVLNLLLFVFISNNLFQFFTLFLISILFPLIVFLIMFLGFKENLLNSLLKTIFSLEIFWILYLSPLGIHYRTIILFVFMIWILNKKIL